MKLLLDTCVWGKVKDELLDVGYDVVWAGEWEEDPGDEEILSMADHDRRILITLDKDFGELATVRGMPHSGIIRLVNWRAKQQGAVCHHILTLYGREIQAGALVTAEPGRVRIRPPERLFEDD